MPPTFGRVGLKPCWSLRLAVKCVVNEAQPAGTQRLAVVEGAVGEV